MDDIKQVNVQALRHLRGAKPFLTPVQYRTLRGQVLAGDAEGALKGLRKLQRRANSDSKTR